MTATEHQRAIEATPLIRPKSADNSAPSISRWNVTLKSRIKILMLIYACIMGFCGATFQFPQFRMMQHLVCYHHVKQNGTGELPTDYNSPICLTNEVQYELANLIAYRRFFMIFPSIMTTMLYGKLADAWGRKPLLYINIAGIVPFVLWIPAIYYAIVVKDSLVDPRLIWTSGLCFFLGGGEATILGVSHAILADVLDASERFRYFSFFLAATLGAEVIAPPLGAWMSDVDVWLPFWMVIPYVIIILILFALIPETLGTKSTSNSSVYRSSEDEQIDSVAGPDRAEDSTEEAKIESGFYRSVFGTRTWVAVGAILFLFVSWNIAEQHYTQYCIKVLGWSLQRASFLTSANAIMNFVIGAVMLPVAYHMAHQWSGMHSSSMDLYTASICLLIFALANAIRGLSRSTIWFVVGSLMSTMGRAALPALKSLGVHIYAENMQSQFFALTAIAEICAGVIADPTAGALFSKGLELGEQWRALFYDVSALSALFTVTLLFVGYRGIDLVRGLYKRLETSEV